MGYKTNKERNAKEQNCLGFEDKPNGSVENRAKI